MSAIAAPTLRRWTARRKAELVGAIREGDLSLDQARESYALSEDELRSWQASLASDGVAGLRVVALDRRKARRREVNEAATAIFHDRADAACTIRDIGANGAKVEFQSAANVPSTFVLRCERTNRAVWVCVVWRRDLTVGLRIVAAPATEARTSAPTGNWLLGEE